MVWMFALSAFTHNVPLDMAVPRWQSYCFITSFDYIPASPCCLTPVKGGAQMCFVRAQIQYSSKLSWEITFMKWWKIAFLWENFCGLFAGVTKRNHPSKFLRRKLSRIATKPWDSQKFSPSEVSRYTVSAVSTKCVWAPPTLSGSLVITALNAQIQWLKFVTMSVWDCQWCT